MATKLKQASIVIRQNKGRDLSPKWDGADEWSGEKFTAHFRHAMTWYRLESSTKDLKPKLVEWMGFNGYDKGTINTVRKIKDKYFSGTMVGIAACLVKGMPEIHAGFNQGRDTAAWLRKEIEKVVTAGGGDMDDDEDVPKVEKPVVYVPNIQERIREQAGQMSEEIDAAIDQWITDPEGFNPKEFKMVSLLRGKGAKAAQTRYIKQIFQRGMDELLELSSGNADEQLREAYSHVSRKNIKKLIEFYESIFTACDQIAQEAKTLKKPRAKKVKPAEELVKKIKFKVSDDKLGISSVPPASIIGAQMAIVYNTKTRKLGIYGSKTSEGLGVKGTSLINFSEKSTQKTLRKPEQQIKEFKDQNTANRVRAWFDKIKATEVNLNGRINAEVMIIKVFK
jgi:DNA-directed RNA polymerase beta' subunit